MILPGTEFTNQRWIVWDATIEALLGQNTQFRFCHVEPTAMLGSVVDFQPVDQSSCFGRFKRLVQRCWLVSVQVVHHQHNFLSFRIMHINQLANHMGKIDLRPPPSYLDMSPAVQRLEQHEQVGRSITLIFIIDALRPPRLHGNRCANFLHQLFALLVQAYHGALGVIRPLVHFQHVFHRGYEISVLLRRNHPLLFQPRLEVVFFTYDGPIRR